MELLIHSSRFKKIKDGSKKSTLRKIKTSPYEYKTGKYVISNSDNTQEQVTVNVSKVLVLKMKEITLDIAKEEGYSDIESLNKTMKGIYPDLTEDSLVAHIVFTKV